MRLEVSFTGDGLINLIRAVTEKGADFRFRVKGFSMSPFIKDGDIVSISALPKNGLGLGRIVAFVNPCSQKLAIHRINGRSSGHYVIKGDGLPDIDGFIPCKNILGLVSKVERKGKVFSLGLGPERRIIAFFSRKGILPIIFRYWNILPQPIRNFAKCRILI